MAQALVACEFAPLNLKRVRRVWKETRLGRARRCRKRRTGNSVALRAEAPNRVRRVDFVHDSCLNGTKLKILSAVDEFTRECLALEADVRLDARRVRQTPARAVESRGAPRFVRSDNGSESVARLLAVFLSESGSGSRFVEPGSPWQNPFVASFHSSLRRDFLDVEAFGNLADAQIEAAVRRRRCNEARPHSSLVKKPPPPSPAHSPSGPRPPRP
jgi:transposase InsO family protein